MLGVVYLVVILVIAVSAIPLMILTNAVRTEARIYIGRNVLDHQLLDKDGRRCGNVDDLAIEGGPGEAQKSSRSSSAPGTGLNAQAGSAGSQAGSAGRNGSESPGQR